MIDASQFRPVDDDLLAERALLERVETKFVFRPDELEVFLGRLGSADYGLVLGKNSGLSEYKNLYFDSADRRFLREHHRGRRPRFKVRIRHHVSRGLSFFEIKEKRPSNATVKARIAIDFQSQTLTPEAHKAMDTHPRLVPSVLHPTMGIDFMRSTLVGFNTPERITIDMGLRFSDGEHSRGFDDLVIVEVKQERFSPRSPIIRALRDMGALQLRVSKYITGAQLLWPDIRLNRYRPRLRMLRRRTA